MKFNVFTKFLIVLSIFFVLARVFALAADDFSTDYDITYDIDQNGVAQVKHIVTIINLKNDVIATNYTLGLKQMDIFDISASDKNGKLDFVQTSDNDQTNLDIRLKTFIIGEGRQNVITILYKSKFVATKNGEVWNINIPTSQAATAATSNHITLTVPKEFGPKIFVSPTPSIEKSDTATTTYSFTNELVNTRSVSAAFGKYQVLNYQIIYQIYNPNRFTSNYEIALPPTISNIQEVTYQSLNPKPERTYEDKDGNYMAVYRLKPKESLDVFALGSAKLTSAQNDPKLGGSFEKLPKDLVADYTKKQLFWETDSAKIKEIAKSLYDDKLTVSENARKIYDYIIEKYSYDFGIAKKDFVDRKGAAKALESTSEWGCMEFTDTFIAIARSMGIPAREINGYAITTTENLRPISVALKSGDLLHAWPEYYDPKFGWVQIDPTWGDTSNTDYFTKLDTNHFAFNIMGIKSDYPLPAGTYRTTTSSKLVEVDFSQNGDNTSFSGKYNIGKTLDLNIFSGLQGKKLYRITNTGTVMLYDNKLSAIPPDKSLNVYLPKTAKSITLRDAFGNEFTQNLIKTY